MKLGQGNVFTDICDSVHGGGVPGPRGVSAPAGGWWRPPPRMATAAGGRHPTGMHSCFENATLQESDTLSNTAIGKEEDFKERKNFTSPPICMKPGFFCIANNVAPLNR